MQAVRYMRRMIIILLLLILTLSAALPAALAGETEQKVVRVGWFDSSFCYWDQFGRRCGIDYEYQHKISAYTGWTYEYVEDSWPNLLQMLMRGEIDLLSDVSYKPEREEYLLYPDLPMGTESYYIYANAENREISAKDLSTLNGKRIGVNQGSVQEGFLQEWADRNGVTLEIVPLVTEEDESFDMVKRGRLDGYTAIYSINYEEGTVPLCRIGASDYFYAVNKSRPDLLAELNMALAGIRDEDPYFNEKLSEERQFNTRTEAYLTADQEDWIAEHGVVRVGYLENYLPFCQTGPETGELTGALKDFLAHAANHLSGASVRFETKPYPTVAAALEAMKTGEIDCAFPVYLSDYDADQLDVRLTSPAMKTGMNAVMRESEVQALSRESEIAIAVPAGNVYEDTFIKEQYPACRIIVFPDDTACYEAVSAGQTANCTLVSNYRMPAEQKTVDKYKLYSVPTGEHVPFSFAVRRADRELYFVLNKMVAITKSDEMDSALASYMHTSQKVSFLQFFEDNWIYVLLFFTAVFAVIIVLLVQRLKAERRASEQQRLLEEAAEIAELKQTITSLLDNIPGMNYTKDAETGVYLACNQAFAEYARQKDPSGVIGRTARDLFDEEMARRFTEEDRVALLMDEPYIFFEDVADAAGSRRQVRTTKLKYTDANGRLCVLGVSQDMSDAFRIRRNQATTKEAYEKARESGIVYTHIAQALARGYTDLYYIDLNTEQFIEYRPDEDSGSLIEARRGWHFFEECQEEADQFVYPEDREAVKKALDRRTLVAELEQNNSFIMTYRLIGEQGPTFVSMKVTRMRDDDRFIVLGVMDIDEEVKQRSAVTRAREEQNAYGRLSALAGDYLCIYVVDPATGRYREFSATEGYQASFAQAREGQDFFTATRDAARVFTHPEDLNRFLSAFTKENVMADIAQNGLFTVSYRLITDGVPRYVQLKAAIVEEKNGPRLIVGINDIDSQVRQEEDYVDHLAKAQIEANIDPLTGVKNRHAYLIAEERLNLQLAENPGQEFAVVILDVNNLKRVNDAEGHQAGDQYLREACRIICKVFSHSPVFRIGGDEFAVISQGSDYACMNDLIRQMADRNEEALSSGGIVIACGMARREGDATVAPVFERADQNMYENKINLKKRG